MTELGGYNHFDFFQDNPPFYTSTYFELINLIREKDLQEHKAHTKAKRESEKKSSGKGKR